MNVTIKLSNTQLKALIQRSSLHAGIKDSKAFTQTYEKLLAAWVEMRQKLKEAEAKRD